MQFSRKRAFSFVEMILIIFVITVGVSGIVLALHRGSRFVQTTRQKVVAINLAREGMEIMYNMRDSNRQRWAGKKDECRLKVDPLDDGGDLECANDIWMQSGFYIILQKELAGQKYFILSGMTEELNIDDGVGSGDLNYSLCQQGGQWLPCPGQWPDSKEGMFWRQIVVKGLYLKDVSALGGEPLVCESGEDSDTRCASDRAKELQFCSRVGYFGEGYGIVELCGVMGNFE